LAECEFILRKSNFVSTFPGLITKFKLLRKVRENIGWRNYRFSTF
jgi:hypothetical protein